MPFDNRPRNRNAGVVTDGDWVRPSDWLPLPEIELGMVGLKQINNTNNEFLSFLVSGGSFTVDWGDGVIETFPSDSEAHHQYDYNNPLLSFLEGDISKQAVVKVTPSSGSSFSSINLGIKHPKMTFRNAPSETGWLDISLKTTENTTTPVLTYNRVGFGLGKMSLLERFSWQSQNNLATDFSFLLGDLPSLKIARIPDTSNVTKMIAMFYQCTSIKKAPEMNTQSVLYMDSMFSLCRSLVKLPLYNTSNVLSMNSIFRDCYSLTTVPLFDTQSVTSCSNMFFYSESLRHIPNLNLSNSINATTAFFGLRSIGRISALMPALDINVSNGVLSAQALNEIYTNLPVVTHKTITVTGNYGAAASNPSIATSKGWTVVI